MDQKKIAPIIVGVVKNPESLKTINLTQKACQSVAKHCPFEKEFDFEVNNDLALFFGEKNT